jgi:hypothetical protein
MRAFLTGLGIIVCIAAILLWALIPFWAFVVLMVIVILVLASGFYHRKYP